MRGQRQEPRLLLSQDLRDRLIAVLGMRPLMGNLVAPAPKLGVEVVDIGKRPRGEERVAEVLNLSLDLPFLIAAPRRAGPRGEVIVPRELEQARMKSNCAALPFEDGTP
jgi:hypothetical protein